MSDIFMVSDTEITHKFLHKDELEVSINNSLDKIQDRVDVLLEKNTLYSLDILNKLNDDLKIALRRLKRGK